MRYFDRLSQFLLPSFIPNKNPLDSKHKIGLHLSSVNVKLFFFFLLFCCHLFLDVIKFIVKEIHNSLYDIRMLVPMRMNFDSLYKSIGMEKNKLFWYQK